MDVRESIHSAHAKTLDTQGLRNAFLVEQVFEADKYTMVYSHIDRIIVGGIMPVAKAVSVGGEVGKQLGVSYFLERRELGVINIGGPGTITVDGQCYEIGHREALYVGKGAKDVVFASIDGSGPAKFYYNCAPAHHMMGQPQETRHIVMHNEQAVISPSWSIHSGVGTKAYTFIWGMVGENQVFDDMDHVAVSDLR